MTTPPHQIIQMAFEMPPEIFARILDGTATFSGQIVRDAATGQFLKHLKLASDTVDAPQAASQPAAQQAAAWLTTVTDKSSDLARGMAQSAKNNPGKSALITVATVGVLTATGVVVKKISQQRRAEKASTEQHNREIDEAARHLDSAIKKWLEAATKAALTAEIINDLAAAYAAYSEATSSTLGALNDLDEWQQDFYARFADYTVKVAQANGIEFEPPEETSNVVDLAPYIASQQDVFARGAGS